MCLFSVVRGFSEITLLLEVESVGFACMVVGALFLFLVDDLSVVLFFFMFFMWSQVRVAGFSCLRPCTYSRFLAFLGLYGAISSFWRWTDFTSCVRVGIQWSSTSNLLLPFVVRVFSGVVLLFLVIFFLPLVWKNA